MLLDESSGNDELLSIQICCGFQAGQSFKIQSLPAILGRSADSDIVLQDDESCPTISRRHLILVEIMPDGCVRILDESTNGTKLGGTMLKRGESACWKNGDPVWIGAGTMIKFSIIKCPKELKKKESYSRLSWHKNIIKKLSRANDSLMPFEPRLESLANVNLLGQAWRHVSLNRGAHGSDGMRLDDFSANETNELESLRRLLSAQRLQPLPPRIVSVPKRTGGQRRLSILTIRDRVVQQALTMLLQPLLEPEFSDASYAYRPNRSAHDALHQVERVIRQRPWIVDSDIADFFDSIDHRRLITMLRQKVHDTRLQDLIIRYLMIGQSGPGKGIAQGAATSPLFGNLYLTSFDFHIMENYGYLIRYSDNFVILCTNRDEAERALLQSEGFLRTKLDLQLKPERTRVIPLERGFTFLGFRFSTEGRRPHDDAFRTLAEKLGNCSDIDKRDSVLRGWRNYFGELPAEFMLEKVGEQEQEKTDHNNDIFDPDKEYPLQDDGKPQETQDSGSKLIEEKELPIQNPILEEFLRLFCGREDAYARQWCIPGGRRGYLPCHDKISCFEMARHLAGEQTLGIYIQQKNGKVKVLVIDIDSSCSDTPGPEAIKMAWDFHREAQLIGLPIYVEDTGGKGRHVWMFFDEAVRAKDTRSLGRLLLARLGGPRAKVTCEIFPREEQCQSLGSLIKLPFGINKVTARPSVFLRDEGIPYDDAAAFIGQLRTIPTSQLARAIQVLITRITPFTQNNEANQLRHTWRNPSSQQFPKAIRALLEGCSLLRRIVERSADDCHLCHSERLILLYIFGRLGKEGAQFLHQVMANCSNYKSTITQRWLDRLDAEHLPLSCKRLKDWLSELYPDVSCHCDLASVRPGKSPIHLVIEPNEGMSCRKKTQETSQEDKIDEAQWAGISNDMFIMSIQTGEA